MNRHSLYVILCSTGSQCSRLRAGFTWSRNDKCMMTRAAAFITRYRGLKRLPSQQSSTPRRRPAPAHPAVRHPISFHATAPINCRNASGDNCRAAAGRAPRRLHTSSIPSAAATYHRSYRLLVGDVREPDSSTRERTIRRQNHPTPADVRLTV